jgi:hypothetical protein
MYVSSAGDIGIAGGRYMLLKVKQRLVRCTAVACSGEQMLTIVLYITSSGL